MAVSVFISYSHQDAELVKPVVGLLRATKDLVWQDAEGIKPGKNWRQQIEQALAAANLVVVFWCDHSARSEEVQKEYKMALAYNRDVLPVLLDSTPLTAELSVFQWVDFRNLVGSNHRAVARRRSRALSTLAKGVFCLLSVCIILWLITPHPMPPPEAGPPPDLGPESFPEVVSKGPVPEPDQYYVSWSLFFLLGGFVAVLLIPFFWLVHKKRMRHRRVKTSQIHEIADGLRGELVRRGVLAGGGTSL